MFKGRKSLYVYVQYVGIDPMQRTIPNASPRGTMVALCRGKASTERSTTNCYALYIYVHRLHKI